MQLLSMDSRGGFWGFGRFSERRRDTTSPAASNPNDHNSADKHGYSRQQARNMVIPAGEATAKEMLSLADTKRTVPRLSVTSTRPVAHKAVASPSMTRRMLALSTGDRTYCWTEGGTCRTRQEVS